jgi:hypothetical protein
MTKRPAYPRTRLHPRMSDADFVRSPQGQAAIRANAIALGIDVDKIDRELAATGQGKAKVTRLCDACTSSR